MSMTFKVIGGVLIVSVANGFYGPTPNDQGHREDPAKAAFLAFASSTSASGMGMGYQWNMTADEETRRDEPEAALLIKTAAETKDQALPTETM